jgi:hypothetical protein
MIESRRQTGRSVVVVDLDVLVATTGARKARGGRWGGLSVPKPPKGVAGVVTVGHGHGQDLLRLSRDCGANP